MKILQTKKGTFQIKISDIFHIPAENIVCGYSLEPPRRGGSNEYPQSVVCSKIRKIMYTPVNSSFSAIKFISSGITEPILVILKYEYRLSLANYSVAYEETQSNRVSDFRNFVCSLFPKALFFDLYFTLL